MRAEGPIKIQLDPRTVVTVKDNAAAERMREKFPGMYIIGVEEPPAPRVAMQFNVYGNTGGVNCCGVVVQNIVMGEQHSAEQSPKKKHDRPDLQRLHDHAETLVRQSNENASAIIDEQTRRIDAYIAKMEEEEARKPPSLELAQRLAPAVRKRNAQYLGKLLADARMKAGLDTYELAMRLDVPEELITRYEDGIHPLDLSELFAVCNALDVDYRDITGPFRRKAKEAVSLEVPESVEA